MTKEVRKAVKVMPKMLPPRGPGGSKSGPGGFQSASGHHVSPKGPPRAPQIALGGGPGGARRRKKNMGPAPGASWREKLIDFTLPGAPQGGPGGALGGHFERFFRQGLPALQKHEKTQNFHDFRSCFCMRFSIVFFAFPAAAAQEHNFKKHVFVWKVLQISHVGRFRAEPKNT